VRELEAWVKRRQLDRDAGRSAKSALRFLGDAAKRRPIGFGIAVGVCIGLGRFAEHVEAVAEPFRALRLGALECFVDVPAEDEVAAEDLHGFAHGGADDRLAKAADGAAESRLPIIRTVLRPFEHLTRQQQRKSGSVDEGRVRTAELFRPIRPGKLVGDQLVRGMRVRDAQQRFGQAHHRNALVRAEIVSAKKCVHARRLLRPNTLDERAGHRGRLPLLGLRQASLGDALI
jgi:hypothetical protein